ncbi:vesicular glutamate transporter 1 [Eurytemora carolleeae]|uniref:vesicular glutamate transporter 1 n=1 Tax=Eurytemora carolleeae TaxID=1294199 RepID=UPI000C77B2C5|nr:vesicular glutamate transporter 1 [Eurytemora carolleeae]XP_023344723.1 vesicular glutamate transporter 1 [Eurytemora carolleeae]|eukprot:XP_023344721.1 vesicular glutamate transporter 1-like [Eurytemora affinis]
MTEEQGGEYSHFYGEEPEKTSWLGRKIKRRYVVAMLAFLGFCNIYMLRVNLSVAVVAMTTNKTHVYPNGTVYEAPDFDWDSKTQGFILASFFYGYIFTQIPGGYLATRYGGKRIFLWGVTTTAILTVLTPPLARMHTSLLIGTRIIAGLCEGVTYPSIHAIWSRWAPPLEQSRITAFAFSGIYMGTVITMPLAGVLAEYIGWDAIFYVFGCIALIWCVVWWAVVEDSPDQDRSITDAELEYLRNTIGVTTKEAGMNPPWGAMFSSKPVWAIIIAHFTENWGFYTLLTSLPMFMRDVLDYSLDAAGLMAAFPYILMTIVVQIAGYFADTFRANGKMTTTHIRKLFTCGAYMGQSMFMLLTALVMSRAFSTVFMSLALGLGGLTWAGFGVNHLDVAPNYAAILMGISNTVGTIPGILSPAVTGAIVKDRTADEWRNVFLITSLIYFLGAVMYGLMASGEKQDWADPQEPLIDSEKEKIEDYGTVDDTQYEKEEYYEEEDYYEEPAEAE